MNEYSDLSSEELRLYNYLSSFVSTGRKAKFEQVLAGRTRRLAVVLEDIFHPHNASAVVRSCECFGVQELHIIQNEKFYEFNTNVVRGSAKWVDITHYHGQPDNTQDCITALKSKGYRIAVTTLRQGVETLPPDKLPLDDKIALCFGCEEKGISDKLHDMADCYVRIPMYGFTDSLNLSVSAAICLSILTSRLRESGIPWQLSEADQNRLRFDWTRCSVKNVEQIIQRFEDENKNG